MSLCEPIVVGPVSVLTESLRVQGQLVGATVKVHALGANPRVVAQGTATSGDQRFPLTASMQLAVGDTLVAVQESGADTSAMPGGDLGVNVAPKPASAAQIGKVGLETHLWTCGQFVWVDGAIPGAQVEMVGHGGGVADEGIARFELTHPLGTAAVSLHQVVPGLGNGPDLTITPDPVPAAFGRGLPASKLGQPVRACDPSVLVSDVLDGTVVTIKHANGVEEQAGFDRSELYFILSAPLAQGDKLSVRQQFQGDGACGKYVGIWSTPPLVVGSAKPVDPPVVEGPLCVGTARITLSGLRPAATVRVEADGNVYEGTVPADRTEFTFGVSPLAGGSVTATQEICAVTSADADKVTVNPQEDVVAAPSVVGPLYDCARSVSVRGAHLGATVQIWAKHAYGEGPISDLVTVHETPTTIGVAPYLHTGDKVYAVQWACSTTGVKSEPVTVAARPKLPVPKVLEAFAGDAIVYVQDVVPGALVEVYVAHAGNSAVYAGHAVATTLSATTPVGIPFALRPRDLVSARQRLCGAVTKLGRGTGVESLDGWLIAHSTISASIVWEGANGAHPWPNWSAQRKAELDQAFALARSGGSIAVAKIPPNLAVLTDTQSVVQILRRSDAWAYFKASVAQSLALETSLRVPWSVSGYDQAELAQLFDGRRMFSRVASPAGYQIEDHTAGTVVPAPPAYSYELLKTSGVIGATSLDTVVNAVEWCHENLQHFPGGTDTANMVKIWHYRGFAPMVRTIEGTFQSSEPATFHWAHWTAGCWGTTGFLIALLRAVNLPVTLVEHGSPAHAQPWFMADSSYLSHGDDPYNTLTWATPPIPPKEILTDEALFDAWFGPGVPAADVQSNIGRRTLELAITYLSNDLLTAYCADLAAGTPRASGQVMEIFSPVYSLAELEAQSLWSRMDAKIATLGGCDHIPA